MKSLFMLITIIAMATIIIYTVFGTIFGYLTRYIMILKGYGGTCFWWGFFFGIFAVIYAMLRPDIADPAEGC